MKRLNTLILVFIIFTIFSLGLLNLINVGDSKTESRSNILLHVMDLPLSIDGNAQLNSTKSSGNGTAGNPYIIEDYVIDASGQAANGIQILNTDAYFILQNCTVSYTDATYDGIYLKNVTNGYLLNNTFNDNSQNGIYIENSSFNTFTNNTANSNWCGINLSTNCNDNVLLNNTANYNQVCISLNGSCESNEIINNTMMYFTLYGLQFYDCNNNTIIGNAAEVGWASGFFLEFSDFNQIHNNRFGNTSNGPALDLAFSDDFNNVTKNLCYLAPLIPAAPGIYNNGLNNTFYRNLVWNNNDSLPANQIYDQGVNSTYIENLLNATGDWDTDGLNNEYEYYWGLDPWNGANDADGDGLNDSAEVLTYGTNPTKFDTDGDGLNDYEEVSTYLTNASRFDTDDDGLNDSAEVLIYHTDAWYPDSDWDGLNDGDEIFLYFTNATKADTDEDGYSDGAEVAAGSDPLDPISISADFCRDFGWLIYLLIAIVGAVVGALVVVRVRKARQAAPAKVVTKAKEPIVILDREILVFISYSTVDAEKYHIREIAAKLEALPDMGEVLYWEKDAHGSIIEYMDANVGKCDIFLLFCSERTSTSPAVKTEWQAALSINKDLLPIFTDINHVPILLRSRRGLRFREDDIDGFVDELHRLILNVLKIKMGKKE